MWLIFFIGFLCGVLTGAYIGNKVFRNKINRCMKIILEREKKGEK